MADAARDPASYDAGYDAGYRDALAHMGQRVGDLFTRAAHLVQEGERFQGVLRQSEAALQARWAEVDPRLGDPPSELARAGSARKPRRPRKTKAAAPAASPALDWSGPAEPMSEPARASGEEAERAVARAWRA